jgi:hypothetical protein
MAIQAVREQADILCRSNHDLAHYNLARRVNNV